MTLVDDSYISFVNLDHRQDRLTHMQSQLSRVGLQADRTRGIPWKEIDCTRPEVQVMFNRTPGAIGCHMSQVSIMHAALAMDKHAFVMEDDLVFCEDFNKRIQIADQFLQGVEWDVLWLGGTFHSPAFWHPVGPSKMRPDCSANLGKDCEPTSNPNMIRTYGAFCTYAYIVNKSSIEKILALFDKHLSVSIGIDWLFIKIQPQLNCYAFVPGMVKQMDNQSDIGNGVTVFSGFSRLNGTVENSAYWYQDRMEQFDAINFQWK